jgi:hypothetical protein
MMPAGFFDKFPHFYTSGNAAWPGMKNRINARYDAVIGPHVGQLNGKRVLDLGSHDGRWSLAALKAGASHVTGIEPRQDLVTQAEENFKLAGIDPDHFTFYVGDALAVMDAERIRVDTAMALGVFYHLHYHVALLQRLRQSGAAHIIVDTQVSPRMIWFSRFKNTISFVTEDVGHIQNGAAEAYPGAGVSIVGHPSRDAVGFLFSNVGFSVTEVDWRPLLAKWSKDGLKDYADGERITFIAERSSAPKITTARHSELRGWLRRGLRRAGLMNVN